MSDEDRHLIRQLLQEHIEHTDRTIKHVMKTGIYSDYYAFGGKDNGIAMRGKEVIMRCREEAARCKSLLKTKFREVG